MRLTNGYARVLAVLSGVPQPVDVIAKDTGCAAQSIAIYIGMARKEGVEVKMKRGCGYYVKNMDRLMELCRKFTKEEMGME